MTTGTLERTADRTNMVARPVKPGQDRLPFQKKVNLLSDRGLWPQMEALAKRCGWHSAEMRAFIDANLPKVPCPICGTPFYVYSRRVKYCSDRCRRAAAAASDRAPRVAHPAQPEARTVKLAQSGDLCVRLERIDGSDRRFYMLMVVQDLFGSVSLIRRWGRDEQERAQRVVTACPTLDQALELLERHKETCLKRGYRLIAVERGRIDPAAL
jgi:predicted DNA-binding WGR domain protein